MPRTFVWHPSKGPRKAPVFALPKKGKVRIKQIRSGIGHPARHRATLRALGLKHHQDVVIQESSGHRELDEHVRLWILKHWIRFPDSVGERQYKCALTFQIK